MSNLHNEYKPVMWKDEMPEAGGEDWMQVNAAQRCSRKRLRKAYADRVRETWHDYDRVVYDYYGYEEEMMKQKEVEKKSHIHQLQEIRKSELHDPIAKYSTPREIDAIGEEQERLEGAERSSRKRNLKAYMDRVRENWHDRLVRDYYGYEEERRKQEEDETKYKEVEGNVRASKRMKLVIDGSYTTNPTTRSRAESMESAYMYEVYMRDISVMMEDQLHKHLIMCKFIEKKLGIPPRQPPSEK